MTETYNIQVGLSLCESRQVQQLECLMSTAFPFWLLISILHFFRDEASAEIKNPLQQFLSKP